MALYVTMHKGMLLPAPSSYANLRKKVDALLPSGNNSSGRKHGHVAIQHNVDLNINGSGAVNVRRIHTFLPQPTKNDNSAVRPADNFAMSTKNT